MLTDSHLPQTAQSSCDAPDKADTAHHSADLRPTPVEEVSTALPQRLRFDSERWKHCATMSESKGAGNRSPGALRGELNPVLVCI